MTTTRTPAAPGTVTDLAGLHRSHSRSLLRLASLLVEDLATCEELVQDAFVAALARERQFRDEARGAAYLRSAVLDGARTHLRRRQVRERARPLQLATFEGSAEAGALVADEHRRVLLALRSLPERQREVLALRSYLELSEREIAETLGIAAGTVTTHAQGGLAALHQLLEDRATTGHLDEQQVERTETRLRAAVAHRVEAVRAADERASLAAIERRVAAARHGRRLRRPGLAVLAVVAAVAVVFGLTTVLDDGGPKRLRTTGPGTTTTTVPATTSTTAAAPSEAGAPDDAVWPPPGREPFADPVAATRSFVEEYLGAPDPPLSAFRPGGPSEGEVDVYLVGEGRSIRRDRVVGTVALRQVGAAWMVVGARSPEIVVDNPRPLDTVASPVVTGGRSQGYEGTIIVTVVELGATPRQPLGRAVGIAAGREADDGLAPFHLEATLDRAPTQPVGSLVFSTDTGCSECNTSFAVVPVRFASAGSA